MVSARIADLHAAQQEPSWCSSLALRLCVRRWPHIASQASKPEGGWKRLYLQHDAQDMHQALDGVPPEMQHIYREVGSRGVCSLACGPKLSAVVSGCPAFKTSCA